MTTDALASDVRGALRAFPDFPVPGILFQDVAPVLADPKLMERVVAALADPFVGDVDAVAAVESRGFAFGAPVALRLGVPLVPVRKRGKLPGRVLAEHYDLEYGRATLEVQADCVREGARVLVVDDVLATGGTAAAAARLVEAAGGRVAGFAFLLGIRGLDGRERLDGRIVVLADV